MGMVDRGWNLSFLRNMKDAVKKPSQACWIVMGTMLHCGPQVSIFYLPKFLDVENLVVKWLPLTLGDYLEMGSPSQDYSREPESFTSITFVHTLTRGLTLEPRFIEMMQGLNLRSVRLEDSMSCTLEVCRRHTWRHGWMVTRRFLCRNLLGPWFVFVLTSQHFSIWGEG